MITGRHEFGVIGAGVVGLSVASCLVSAGSDVTCFEAGIPGHGQSIGLTRLFRHRHDDDRGVQIAVEARRAWRQWEQRSGRRLMGDEGVLIVGPNVPDEAKRLQSADVRFSMAPRKTQKGFLPVFSPVADEGLFEIDGGAIRAARTIDVLCSWLGSRVVRAEVVRIRASAFGVRVETQAHAYDFEKVVICAGMGTVHLAKMVGLAVPFKTQRMIRCTFAVDSAHRGKRMACLLDYSGASGACAYGAACGTTSTYAVGLMAPDDCAATRGRSMTKAIPVDLPPVERLRRYVVNALPGLDPSPVETTECCVTLLPWGEDAFAAWRTERVLAIGGNNLFKLAPRLGELVASAMASGDVPPALQSPG